jgi:leucyl-tRNA synthetase
MISALMEFVNLLSDRFQAGTWRTATYHRSLECLLVLLAPAAPFISEELWHLIGYENSVHTEDWPVWDNGLTEDETIQIPIQINGKVRAVVEVPLIADQAEVETVAFNLAKVQKHIVGGKVVKVIYVPGKIINFLTEQSQND